MNRWHLNQAARAVNSGGVIAYPTEAVYGLGCRPEYSQAACRILTLKGRSISKGLILIAAEIGQIEQYVIFPNKKIRERVISTWPGPVTWVLPAKPQVPVWIRGDHNSVAVRVSDHRLVQALCMKTGALVSTSANPANCPPAKTALKVTIYFGSSLDYILPGKTGENLKPTEIRDAISGNILREGG